MSCLAIIPARGGSKRIPLKNIKNFLGKPIISYSIEAAINSAIFDEIMVSTDDYTIADIALKYGAKVPFYRSQQTANDFATLAEVCIEVVDNYAKKGLFFEKVCCILPTAPFVNADKLIAAKSMLLDQHYDCVFPVEEYSSPIQRSLKIENGNLKMLWPENMTVRSQDLEKTYHDAGQFYFVKTAALLQENKLFVDRVGAIITNSLEVQDIDTLDDWKLAEIKFKFVNGKQESNE